MENIGRKKLNEKALSF